MPGNVAVPALTLTTSSNADVSTIKHNDIELEINNTLGDTVIRNATQKALVIDHADSYIGIFTGNPGYTVDVKAIVDGATVNLTGISTIQSFVTAGAVQGRTGTRTTDKFSIATDNTDRISISSTGQVTIPDAYAEIVGATNRDLYIDNSGKLGTLLSSERYKENILPFSPGGANPIFNLNPVTFDYKDSTLGTEIIGFTAEDVATKIPKAASFQAFKKLGNDLIKFDRARTQNIKTIESNPRDTPFLANVTEITEFDPEMLNYSAQDAIILPETYSSTKLIPYLVAAVQYLKAEIEKLGQ